MAQLQGQNLEQLSVKPIFLMYAAVRESTDPPYSIGDPTATPPTYGDYAPLMGILRGGGDGDQADPEETTIDGELYDAPFVTIPTLQPYERNITLIKYKLSDLHAFIPGGTYTPATATVRESWIPPKGAPIIMYEFVWGYATGKMERIFNGQVTFARTSPSDGAAGYRIKITALANDVGNTYEDVGLTT